MTPCSSCPSGGAFGPSVMQSCNCRPNCWFATRCVHEASDGSEAQVGTAQANWRESPPGWSHPFDQIDSNHRKLESQLYFDQCLSSPPKSTGITPVNRTTFVGACRFEELLTSRERSSAFTPTGAASPRSDRPHQQVWIRRRST